MIFEVASNLFFVAFGIAVVVTWVAMLVCIMRFWRQRGWPPRPYETYGKHYNAIIAAFSRGTRSGNIAQIGFTVAICLFPFVAILAALRPDLPV